MTMLNGEPIETPNISTAPPAGASEDPRSRQVGSVIGLLALIFAFVFPLAGAIIGGIALGQARKGGYKNPLALWGMILGIVFTVAIVAIVVIASVFTANLLSEVIDVCRELGSGTHEYNGITYDCS